MTLDDAALRALCDAATPGPWDHERLQHDDGHVEHWIRAPGVRGMFLDKAITPDEPWAEWTERNRVQEGRDAAFIAAAREALPALLDRVAAAEAKLAVAVAALNSIACWHEGPEVTGTFDEPGSAQEAREALAAVERKETT